MIDESLEQRYESVTRGYYCPSFFKLRVNVLADLDDPEKLDPLPQSTFFHEYIHFLQDISTTYGMTNSIIIVDQMKFANNDILLNPASKFDLPIDCSKDSSVNLNNQLQNIYLGLPYTLIDGITIKKIKRTKGTVWLPSFNKYAPVIKIELDDPGKTKFDFGAIHIMETMCHIAQQCFDPTITHSDVPYRTAELVAKKIYPLIGDNPYFVFALCDACLMHLHPGDCFYQILRLMSQQSFIPKVEKEIYDFVFDNIKATNGDTLLQIFKKQNDLAILQLSGYFTTANFNAEKIWITHVLETARDLRLNHPGFLLDLIKEPKLYSDKLKDIIKLLGTPLLQNLVDECCFHYPQALAGISIHPERFAAILEIHRLFFSQQKKCDLKSFCTASKNGPITDLRCDTTPWERGMDNNMCAYGQFWKTWGLNAKQPV